jgi:hypothetical protein
MRHGSQALWQAFAESIKNAITLFEILTTADFWVGMGKALLGIAQGLIAFLLEGVAKLLDYLKEVPLVGDKVGDTAQSIGRPRKASATPGRTIVTPAPICSHLRSTRATRSSTRANARGLIEHVLKSLSNTRGRTDPNENSEQARRREECQRLRRS